MRQTAAVLCHDKSSLQTLTTTLEELGIEQTNCRSQQGSAGVGDDGTLLDPACGLRFTGSGFEVIRMANPLPPAQNQLIAVAKAGVAGDGAGGIPVGREPHPYRPLEATS